MMELPDLPDEPRRDLTGLPAFAIDDEGNLDPDDALSLDGDRLWVHVADAAALIGPDSPADIEARARGATLLPAGNHHPDAASGSHSPAGAGFDRDIASAVFRLKPGCEWRDY